MIQGPRKYRSEGKINWVFIMPKIQNRRINRNVLQSLLKTGDISTKGTEKFHLPDNHFFQRLKVFFCFCNLKHGQ